MKYHVTIGGETIEVLVDGDTITIDGESHVAHINEVEGSPIRVLSLGNAVHRIPVRRGASRGEYSLWVDGHRIEVEALDDRSKTIRELSRASAGAAGPAPLKAPMPGMIVRVSVVAGDQVEAGQGLVVMEAMKMENELRAAAAGVVKAVLVQPGNAVEKGNVLIEMQ